MVKVTTRHGSVIFVTLEDAIYWILSKSDKLFVDDSYIKISFVNEFCEDYVLEDLKK